MAIYHFNYALASVISLMISAAELESVAFIAILDYIQFFLLFLILSMISCTIGILSIVFVKCLHIKPIEINHLQLPFLRYLYTLFSPGIVSDIPIVKICCN